MRFGKGAWALVTALDLWLLSGSPCGAEAMRPMPIRALMDVLAEDRDAKHFDTCGAAPKLQLNEVCSVGTECDSDVRIADFVEVYNPTGQAAPLACYVIANDEDLPFVPRGQLEPGSLDAWGESQLQFRIAKKRDQVTLYRMHAIDGKPGLEVLDQVEVAATQALAYRSPDGGGWVLVPALDAEWEGPASFKRPNP
ncbi:MAG: hypothetical protein CL938_19820 [Deltaproteobacteria bacterium]|nr:hypothetical protein [Deltaproteobacteria bacterium]